MRGKSERSPGRRSGEANIINGTSTKRFAIPVYSESARERERKKEEERHREKKETKSHMAMAGSTRAMEERKMWPSWLQCR